MIPYSHPGESRGPESRMITGFRLLYESSFRHTREGGYPAAFYGFPLKACGNDGLVALLTFMFRCDHQVMTVRRNDNKKQKGHFRTSS